MVSPAFLSMTREAANNNHIAGPLAITFSVIAIWEINRNAIKANLLIGAWLLLAIFILPYNNVAVMLSNGLCGLLLCVLALKKQPAKQNYGGGWRSLFQHNPPHLAAAEKESAGTKT